MRASSFSPDPPDEKAYKEALGNVLIESFSRDAHREHEESPIARAIRAGESH